jgi:hypothetical protein
MRKTRSRFFPAARASGRAAVLRAATPWRSGRAPAIAVPVGAPARWPLTSPAATRTPTSRWPPPRAVRARTGHRRCTPPGSMSRGAIEAAALRARWCTTTCPASTTRAGTACKVVPSVRRLGQPSVHPRRRGRRDAPSAEPPCSAGMSRAAGPCWPATRSDRAAPSRSAHGCVNPAWQCYKSHTVRPPPPSPSSAGLHRWHSASSSCKGPGPGRGLRRSATLTAAHHAFPGGARILQLVWHGDPHPALAEAAAGALELALCIAGARRRRWRGVPCPASASASMR